MPDTIPGYLALPCGRCGGGSTIYLPPNLLGHLAYGQDPGNREVDCPDCQGTGRAGWSWVGDPALLDTSSSASRQHYIDTGRYLTHAETAEFATGAH